MQSDATSKTSKTKKQVIVVVVLVVGLIVALKTQPSDETLTAENAGTTQLAITPVALQPEQQTAALQPEKQPAIVPFDPSRFTVNEIPRRDLSVLAQTDLFQISPRLQPREQPAIKSAEIKVLAIYGDHAQNRHAALIGEKIVRSGQALSNGQKITDISHSGITISQ